MPRAIPCIRCCILILAFVNAAGLFLLLGAEFLAMILVVVYVGAVAVLFLFVVMMLDVDFAELREGFLQYLPVGALIGVILLAELLMVVGAWVIGAGTPRVDRGADRRPTSSNTEAIGLVLYTKYRLLLPGGRPGAAGRHDRRHRADAAPQAKASSARTSPIRTRARRRPPSKSARCSRGRGSQYDPEKWHRADHAGTSMTIGLGHYLSVAAILFTLGIFGIFLNRKNVIIILMSIELILLAVNINLVAFSTLPRRHCRARFSRCSC